ncbi:tRNA 2-selenouridine(34) synthase MnmH [Persicitalea jodogahamensis]|uniref:tRNA 2-selenouridine synthase n=1 Tax=Persicitalea jodogahamensis TaxID=402147 RepID=A0A8J3GA21_9BACT|nr:tRNA 2-selenouridine(34) synthase MnmH [Persicitalea jodogahamensis]GHB71018.1 tRNA 2-selenouridine synthase [Persicitalea jodogahamensis]
MPTLLPPSAFLQKAEKLPVVDVRSPGEFAQGHIPGAVNIPLFSNEERAQVGTAYKQVSQDDALLLGLELVGPKMADFVRSSKILAPEKEILVHCWRGGMRSGSFGWLLETAGMKVSILVGGYKAFRNEVLSGFVIPQNIIILGGKTGSGKTEILHQLRELGEQVIDLEGLAHHKGSSYGAIGQLPQPSSEHFENRIYNQWRQLDPARRVWVEDESRTVGRCLIPQDVWTQMQNAPLVLVDMDKATRIERLVREYACFDINLLYEATDRIKKRLGGQHHKAAIAALDQKDFASVADITLTYYDKTYQYGVGGRNVIHVEETTEDNPAKLAEQLLSGVTVNG